MRGAASRMDTVWGRGWHSPPTSNHTCGALGGVNGAVASGVAASNWKTAVSGTPVLFVVPILETETETVAAKVCSVEGTGAHALPRVYFTPDASTFPLPSCRAAVGTSTAKLKRRTAEPVLGGIKLAAIVSTFLAAVGGHVSLITTTCSVEHRRIRAVVWSRILAKHMVNPSHFKMLSPKNKLKPNKTKNGIQI